MPFGRAKSHSKVSLMRRDLSVRHHNSSIIFGFEREILILFSREGQILLVRKIQKLFFRMWPSTFFLKKMNRYQIDLHGGIKHSFNGLINLTMDCTPAQQSSR